MMRAALPWYVVHFFAPKWPYSSAEIWVLIVKFRNVDCVLFFRQVNYLKKKIVTDTKEFYCKIYVFDNHRHKAFVCFMKLAKCSMVKSNYGNFCSRENHAHRVGPSQNCLLANSCQCIKYASLTLLIFLSGRFVSLNPEIRTYLFVCEMAFHYEEAK